jgi:2-isopropylmalate synthase
MPHNTPFSPLTPVPLDPARVVIFDTSLRDGEQAPGFSLKVKDKLLMAHALKDLGVDVIEAGFAAASPGDEEAIFTIAKEVIAGATGPTFCSLARALESDIEAAARALSPARRRRCHLFLATSPIHREAKLKKTRTQVLEIAAKAVASASKIFDEVEFSPEDAMRTEPDFLYEVTEAVIEQGARIINLPDTVGYTTPVEIHNIFSDLIRRINRKDVIFSAHCHNDLGLAVANSLSALQAGARQVECSINGIGERAGNCALEEIVMALRTRPDVFGLSTGIDTKRLSKTSRLLARATGSIVMRNKAVVGKNAFAHESGIHQHGMLNDARTYEIIRPEDVGAEKSNMVLGKHSGRHAIAKQAEALGFDLDELALGDLFTSFKRRADEIGEIDEFELKSLITRTNSDKDDDRIQSVICEVTHDRVLLTLDLVRDNGQPLTVQAEGITALEAGLTALIEAYQIEAKVVDTEILQAGFGFEGGALADIALQVKGVVYNGRGRGPDPVWAGLRALCDGFEKSVFLASRAREAAQSETKTTIGTEIE